MRPSPIGFWLPVRIAKVIGIPDHWVASLPRLAFEGLELCDGKLSHTVLRGLGASDGPRLPGLTDRCNSSSNSIFCPGERCLKLQQLSLFFETFYSYSPNTTPKTCNNSQKVASY